MRIQKYNFHVTSYHTHRKMKTTLFLQNQGKVVCINLHVTYIFVN